MLIVLPLRYTRRACCSGGSDSVMRGIMFSAPPTAMQAKTTGWRRSVVAQHRSLAAADG
jgi:hypothetical protein